MTHPVVGLIDDAAAAVVAPIHHPPTLSGYMAGASSNP
jgi:hypothetical protein